MDLVATRVAAGLVLALLGVSALVALSRLAGRRHALVLPLLATGVASALAWQALVPLTWAPLAVSGAVGLGAALAVGRTGWPRWRSPGRAETLALVLLAVSSLYAALPDYRYDQWNYHLVVPRAVKQGPLAPPVLNDHAAFTGVWEYLFTVPRALSEDDLFNQSAVDAFSWVFLAAGLYLLARRLSGGVFPRGPTALLVLVWTLFGLPDAPGRMNAKPDPVLLLAALAVVDLLARPRSERSRLDAFLLGAYLVAPLALKVSWLHFALVMVPVGAWAWRPPWPRPLVAAGGAGALAGTVAAAPFLLKNARLFDNPLHPAQWGPFRSSFWSPTMEEYWRTLVQPAVDAGSYARTLAHLPLALVWHLWILVLPLLLLALVALARRLGHGPGTALSPGGARIARVGLALALLHLLTWPLFFGGGIGARFVFPGLAALVAVLWVAMGRVFPAALGSTPARGARTLAMAALFLPALVFGRLPEQASRLWTWGPWSVARFVREGPPQWRMLHDMWTINEDRRRAWPEARFADAVTLVATHGVFLLEGASLQAGGPEYEWHRARARCAWDLLLRFDVRYVFARTGRLDVWIPELRPLADGLRPLSDSGQSFAVDRSFLEDRLADDPACAADGNEVSPR